MRGDVIEEAGVASSRPGLILPATRAWPRPARHFAGQLRRSNKQACAPESSTLWGCLRCWPSWRRPPWRRGLPNSPRPSRSSRRRSRSPQPPDERQTQARQTPLAELEPMKLALDQIQATLRREDLSVETLGELETSLTPVRDNLRAKLADLERRLAQLDERRKQFGPPPAAGAPAESPTITAERGRFNQFYSDVDAGVKQARLLAARADALNEPDRRTAARSVRPEPAPALLQRARPVLLDRGGQGRSGR